MVYCDHCFKNVSGLRLDDGPLCCDQCGKVLEDYHFSEEPTFVKNTAGQSQLSGNYVKSVQENFSASRIRTLERARDEMQYISFSLGVSDDNMAEQAKNFYRIALDKNFTKGRKSEQVQAACLYIAFRQNDKPYLLIDFSNYLRTNVYVLGAVFLQLCKVLRLDEHPIVQKPVDPSLFIYKYTNNLLKERNVAVSETALSIIASMKRDWMQTGRKPSGLCGAALYMSALAHGFKCSKSDILRIVHVCEATLTKRLVEFESTESASLTIEDLNLMAREHEKQPIKLPNGELSATKDLLCEHKGSGVPHFALGLCETCYKDFDKLSGGLCGGLDPPAFQRAERERMEISLSEGSANKSDDMVKASNGSCESRKEEIPASESKSIGADDEHSAIKDDDLGESCRDDKDSKAPDEDSLSDIDDLEVDGYLHNEEEKHYKKIIWESMNREYLEEQAAKEAAAAAAKKAYEANFLNCSEDVLAARELAATAAAAVAKSRKEMRQKRAQEAKNSGPAQSAVEATCQMFRTKRLSSKVNYDRLEKLFGEPVSQEKAKKVRFEERTDQFEFKSEDKIKDDAVGQEADEFKSEDKIKDDAVGQEAYEFGDGDMAGGYGDDMYHENAYNVYDYEGDAYDDY